MNTINTPANCDALWACIYDPARNRHPDAWQRVTCKLAELAPWAQITYRVTGPHAVEVTVNGSPHTLVFGYVPDGGPVESLDHEGGVSYNREYNRPLGHWRHWEPGYPGAPVSDEQFVAYFAARAVPYHYGYLEWAGPKPSLVPAEPEIEDRTPWQKGDDQP